jgi:hypothetical protein
MNMNDSSTEIARINRPAIGPARFLRNVIEIDTVDQAMEVAKMMAIAKQAVPKHLRNEPGMCLAVILQAKEWEMAPYAVARKSYVVNDTLAYESQLIHAVIEARAPLKTRLNCRYEGEGPTRKCIVVGTFQGDTEPREYASPQIKDIKVKNSPLWSADQDQQLFYYSSRAWCRKWCPDVLLGVYAPDEIAPGADNAQPIIHNPLQDDAEVGEVPPKQLRDDATEAIDNEARRSVVDDDVEEIEGDTETGGSGGGTVSAAKPPRQARRKAQGEPKPAEPAKATPAEKANPAPNPALAVTLEQPWAKLGPADYIAYLWKWTEAWVTWAQDPNGLRDRYMAERDIRNNLGTAMDQKQLAEAKAIAAGAFNRLGGVLQ